MKTKPKIIICSIIFTVGMVINIFFSATVNGLLTRQLKVFKLLHFNDCLNSIFMNRQHLMLFLCFQGFVLVIAAMYFFTNFQPYQSDLVQITPDIKTPVPVGQYQHGSAKWLTDEEKDKALKSYTLDSHNEQIKVLIESGYEDLEFLKKGG